jgi:hypothetical protein
VKKIELATPVNVQMAVQGSHTKVNFGMKVDIHYQEIKESRYFDIINLSNYDLILGTPFMYQHQISVTLDPPAVIVGSVSSCPMNGDRVTKLASNQLELYEANVDEIQRELVMIISIYPHSFALHQHQYYA